MPTQLYSRLFHGLSQMKIFIAVFLVAVLQLQFVQPASAADANTGTALRFHARLSPNPISFATRNTLTGSGEAIATLQGNTLSLQISFQGLQGKATLLELRHGPKAIPGPVVINIPLLVEGDGKQGKFRGDIQLSAEQKQALVGESVYIQLNSEVAKDGNLRGWLLPHVK